MKFKYLLFTVSVLVLFNTFGQNQNEDQSKEQLKDDIYSLEKICSDQKHELEKANLKLDNLEKRLEELTTSQENRLNTKIEALDTKYTYYLIFGGAFITLIGFLINFFGRQLIKTRVENLIQRTATDYAEKKTDEVIEQKINDDKIIKTIKEKGAPAIDALLTELQTRGSSVITGIKNRGEEAISSMLATQFKEKEESKEGKSDAQIKKINEKSRADEFFDMAMDSDDSVVQIELYKKVLEIEPKNIYALNNIGVSYNNSNNHEKAIEYLNKAIKLKSNYGLAYANLAHSYNQMEQLDKALEIVDKAIELKANLDWSYSVKGNILTKKKKLEEAEKAFGLAIAHNPKSAEAHLNRGYFYEETGKYDLSEADYLKSQELGFKNKALLYNNFAVLYRRKKEFDKAITYLEKARKENPEFGNVDGTLSLIYADQGDDEKFYKYLEIALAKGCPAWNYLWDPGFDNYRESERLKELFAKYKKT